MQYDMSAPVVEAASSGEGTNGELAADGKHAEGRDATESA